jgi:hypothetical protein
MKLNLELLEKIKSEISDEHLRTSGVVHWPSIWPEVCRRYSEQIIKCDMCDGNGEKEGHHDTLGDCPVICSFCEGEGYLKD